MKNKNPRVEELLLELQDASRVRERVPQAILFQIMEIDGSVLRHAEDLLRLIETRFPSIILSDEYRQRKAKRTCEDREMMREGEFAPLIKVPKLDEKEADEPFATPKQKRFLRTLGVRDEAILKVLGKRQASELIDSALEQRDQVPADRRGCMGIVVIGLTAIFVVYVGIRCVT